MCQAKSQELTSEDRLAEVKRARDALSALLLVSSEPLSVLEIMNALQISDKALVEEAIVMLTADYNTQGGIFVEEIGGGFRLATKPQFDEPVKRLLREIQSRRLSRQALETLAIIAYRQPVTTPEIEALRGVDPTSVLKSLIERRLIKIAGRKDVVGRPLLWRTTREFLSYFGLRSIKDLPAIEELGEFVPDIESTSPTLFPAREEE